MSKSVYGYWIAPNEIIEVSTWGHEEAAHKILAQKHGVLDMDINVYDLMFFLGYVRVVNDWDEDGGHRAQHWAGAKHSKLQKQFIKEAADVDEWNLNEKEIQQAAQVAIKQLT